MVTVNVLGVAQVIVAVMSFQPLSYRFAKAKLADVAPVDVMFLTFVEYGPVDG
jgi:hypothetical protein